MAIFKMNVGFQINQETGAIEGNNQASSKFSRRIPDWMQMSVQDLTDEIMNLYGSAWKIVDDSEPEPSKSEPEPSKQSKKKGVFSKSKDDEEKVGD
ncbi:MAG TPA: hypothetical protein DHN29_06295 [Cytophagales bacterium]|nr:hypothetical protein [Cytophagales bacterium]|tara:strand:+ start:383 stop:670 length:288 start_codon:yes stop_codon:yes gene_type:complete